MYFSRRICENHVGHSGPGWKGPDPWTPGPPSQLLRWLSGW